MEMFEWYALNTDIFDFVKRTCYKNYDEYLKWKQQDKDDNKTPKLELEE